MSINDNKVTSIMDDIFMNSYKIVPIKTTAIMIKSWRKSNMFILSILKIMPIL